MYYPAHEAEPQVEPVVDQFIVTSHDPVEQRGLGWVSTVQDTLVENEAEYEHQFIHDLHTWTQTTRENNEQHTYVYNREKL